MAPAGSVARALVVAVLALSLVGTAVAVWGLGAQDRISSDLYDVRNEPLDPENSAIEAHFEWVLSILNGADVSVEEVETRLSFELRSRVPPAQLLADVAFLIEIGPFDYRGFELDITGRELTTVVQAADGTTLDVWVAAFGPSIIDGLLLTPSAPDSGPFSPFAAIAHLVGSWGLLLAGAATWLRRFRPLAGGLLLSAGVFWLAQMLELSDASVLYTIGLISGPLALVLLAAGLLAFDGDRLRGSLAQGAMALVVLAAFFTVAPLFAIDTALSSLPPQLLSVTHDRDLSEVLAVVGQALTLVASLSVVAVLVMRQRRGAGIGRHRRLGLTVVASVVAATLVGVAGWGLVSRHMDLSQSALISLAIVVVPVGLVWAALRENQVALDGVASMVADSPEGRSRSALQESLAQALGDPTVALAFWSGDRGEYVSTSGQPVSVAATPDRAVTFLGSATDPIGAVLHDPALLAEPHRVQTAAAATQLAIESERSQALAAATLRASRSRIVESAEQARRSVERDLHDGAQQRLIAVQLALKLEQQRASSTGVPVSDEFLGSIADELGGAIVELRELGRGLRPSALDHGLQAAVQSLAERSPLPIVVDVTQERFPSAYESAAYFVVNEAVANATRHSGADHVRVKIARSFDEQRLCVQVADEGTGGADKTVGSGLQSLEDRVLALDGSWKLESSDGGGTVVAAEFPLRNGASR